MQTFEQELSDNDKLFLKDSEDEFSKDDLAVGDNKKYKKVASNERTHTPPPLSTAGRILNNSNNTSNHNNNDKSNSSTDKSL